MSMESNQNEVFSKRQIDSLFMELRQMELELSRKANMLNQLQVLLGLLLSERSNLIQEKARDNQKVNEVKGTEKK